MRAVLVKVGTLLAPNCFRVALGDEKMESSERQEKEEKQGRGVDTAGEEGGGREERGSEKVSEDSEYSGIVRLEGKEEGEEEAGEKGKEMWYEVIKDQVQVHKEAIGTDDDADRLAHCVLPVLALYSTDPTCTCTSYTYIQCTM